MHHSAKYLIHANIRTNGVVERSDVVGAVFGQTEGLLGEELDLRELQESSKVGRIDVDIESVDGQSAGTFTVATGLDQVETAVLAASFETIDRVGPCRAECTIEEIEDVRAAKRREVVDRATELLVEYEETAVTGERLVEEVRERARVEEITQYGGLPAGPHVGQSDAIIVVEGRADVRQLLKCGIKNAIAVEGTNVPDEVAELTTERTTTAFLDGDRGGDLILRELIQVGDVDYVAFAPDGQSVEDLTHGETRAALHRKIPVEHITDDTSAREAFAPTDGGTVSPAHTDSSASETQTESPAPETQTERVAPATSAGGTTTVARTETESETPTDEHESHTVSTDDDSHPASDERETSERTPQTLAGHIDQVVGSGAVRLLDADLGVVASGEADAAFDLIAEAETVPRTVVLDGPVSQRLLDIAAQRGIGQLVGTETEEFVKQPASVRVRTASEIP